MFHLGGSLTTVWMQKQSAVMRGIFVCFYRPNASRLMDSSSSKFKFLK